MTADAQSALRRTMETYSKLTRFCLICNYVTRIIEPLASRCAKFRFRPLEEKHSKERLEMICRQEEVKISPEAILSLIRVSEGDLRKAIMYLQSASRLMGKGTEIGEDVIADIAGVSLPSCSLLPHSFLRHSSFSLVFVLFLSCCISLYTFLPLCCTFYFSLVNLSLLSCYCSISCISLLLFMQCATPSPFLSLSLSPCILLHLSLLFSPRHSPA